jgi:uncharacterized protein YodC (DUF2158 family)
MENINIGDIVKLKGGGPQMTVCGFKTLFIDEVLCQWFEKCRLHSGYFPKDALEKVEEKKEAE